MSTTAVQVALMMISSMAVGQAAGGDPVAASRPATPLSARAVQMVNVTLLDDRGKPLPKVHVYCAAKATDGVALSEDGGPTDDGGRVAIECAKTATQLRVFVNPWDANWYGSVEVAAGKEWPIAVVLKAQRTLSLSGKVVDDKDQPVAGATVRLHDSAGQPAGICKEPSDAKGGFTVKGVHGPGEYELVAWGPGGLEAALKLTIQGSRDDLTLKGVYRPKIDRVELVLKWPATATQPARPVEDFDGMVQCVQGQFRPVGRFERGRCVMQLMPPGRYTVFLYDGPDVLPVSTTMDLQLGDRERVIEVARRPTVPVQVINGETGAPVANVVVRLYETTPESPRPLESLRTDATGKVVFTRGCFVGEIQAGAPPTEPRDLAPCTVTFELKDHPNGVVVKLPKATTRGPTTGPGANMAPPPASPPRPTLMAPRPGESRERRRARRRERGPSTCAHARQGRPLTARRGAARGT